MNWENQASDKCFLIKTNPWVGWSRYISVRALSLSCSVARGNQCGGGEGLTSSPICRVKETLEQR